MDFSIASVLASVSRHRFLSLAIIAVGLAATVAAALLLRPVYRAEVVLLPVTDESGMGELAAPSRRVWGTCGIGGRRSNRGGVGNETRRWAFYGHDTCWSAS